MLSVRSYNRFTSCCRHPIYVFFIAFVLLSHLTIETDGEIVELEISPVIVRQFGHDHVDPKAQQQWPKNETGELRGRWRRQLIVARKQGDGPQWAERMDDRQWHWTVYKMLRIIWRTRFQFCLLPELGLPDVVFLACWLLSWMLATLCAGLSVVFFIFCYFFYKHLHHSLRYKPPNADCTAFPTNPRTNSHRWYHLCVC